MEGSQRIDPHIGVNGCCGMAMHQLAADLLKPPLHAALLAENTPWKLPIMEAVIRQTAAHTGRAVPPDAVFEPLDVHQVDEIPRQLYRINNGRRSTLGFGDPPSTSDRPRSSYRLRRTRACSPYATTSTPRRSRCTTHALATSSQTFELALAIDHVLSSDDSAKMFTNIGVVAHGPAHYARS